MEVLLGIVGLAVLLFIVASHRGKAPRTVSTEPDRRLESETSDYSPPARASVPASDARWIPAGEEVSLAGYRIQAGLFYMGTALPSVSGYGDEPALIDAHLPADGNGAADVDSGYARSYQDLAPTARAAFLQWLAHGRPTEDARDWMVDLFVYGLERRVIIDGQNSITHAEVKSIRDELARLGTGTRAWRCSPLLDLIEVFALESPVYQHKAPLRRNGYEVPLVTRVALGQLVADGQPIGPDWAYSWLYGSLEYNPRTPATRCTEEFRKLFRIRFTERFGEGLRLQANKTKLRADYRPISPSFLGTAKLTLPDVPDIAALKSPLRKVADVAEVCCNELDVYSRWIGRKGEGDSLPALAFLPRELIIGHDSSGLASLASSLERAVGTNELGTTTGADLLRSWPTDAPDKFTKAETVQLAQLLEKLGYGIEPDIRFGGSTISKKTQVIVFRMPVDAPNAPAPEYSGAVLLMRLSTAVATADGASQVEQEFLEAHLESALRLTTAERIRLKAHVRWLLDAHPGLTGLRKQLEGLSDEQRARIGGFLVSAAGADGFVSPKEIKVLTKLFQLIGLGVEEVFKQVHALAAEPTPSSAAPVTIIEPEPERTYPIPSPPPPAPAGRVMLDMRRVEATLAETAEVSKLLGTIFVDDEPAPPVAVKPPTRNGVPAIDGLETDHVQLLITLSGRPSWKRDEVEQITADMGLLTDGAVEAINDAAFSMKGDPVIEGEDPLEVNVGLAREMLA